MGCGRAPHPTVICFTRRSAAVCSCRGAGGRGGGALQGFDGDVAFCLQDAIDLRPAGMHPFGERCLGDALALHLLGRLPGEGACQRLGLRGLADAVLGQEAVEGPAPMGVFLCLAFISFIRRRARSRSSAGVFRVFLMNPWTTPILPSSAKNSTRAMRWLASVRAGFCVPIRESRAVRRGGSGFGEARRVAEAVGESPVRGGQFGGVRKGTPPTGVGYRVPRTGPWRGPGRRPGLAFGYSPKGAPA